VRTYINIPVNVIIAFHTVCHNLTSPVQELLLSVQ
jgi:hypothetical protein